jgi:hypothetical protein
MAEKQESIIDQDFKRRSFLEIQFGLSDDLVYLNTSSHVTKCIIGELTLETINFEGCKFYFFHFTGIIGFKIHDKTYPCTRHESRAYWEDFSTSPENIVDLVNHLITSKSWAVTSAPTEQFDKFNTGEFFTENDVKMLF